ncbi:MAG TPA: DUF6152 family protein [Terriglobia bacterium]|nr:DUF6152 family protein [Terriglobia bacterium]
MKRFILLLGLMATALGMTVGVYAHHSAAGVDTGKTVTIEGTVKQFKWANPHSWVELEVPNSKGGVDIWNFEMTSPTYLVQAGWKATTLKPGDKVKVTGNPMKNGDPGGLFVSIVLPSGQTLSQRGGGGGRRGPAPAPGGAAPRGPAPGGN